MASFFATILFSAFSQTNEHAWCSDVTDMRYAFDRLADDIAKHREDSPFLEREFYEHILELPISVETPHFVSRLTEKRELLKKAQSRLEYCKTNETAFLQVAVHLGLLVEIPTNTWYAEAMQARIKDVKLLDMALAQKGLPPRNRCLGYSGGRLSGEWERRCRAMRRWNSTIKDYRRGVLEDVRENLSNCESRLNRRDAWTLRYLFARIARLTEEEKEFVFGPAPKSGDIAPGGAVTNATKAVP